MQAKYFLSLLSVIILTAGVVLAQQPAPPPAPEPPDEPMDQSFSIFIDGGGFLGIYAENISRENMARYHVNQVRGVGVTQVIKDSPAEKAGLRKDDVILRLDGENVSSVRKLNRLVSEMAPDQSVKVSFSRGGAEQEVTATIGKRTNQSFANDVLPGGTRLWKWEGMDPKTFKWEGPLMNRGDLFGKNGDLWIGLGNGRRIGVSTMELTKQLADYFGIAGGKGVLVTSVTDDGPAAKAGVRAGDVITAIDGEAVDSPGDISRAINRKKEGDVTLTIIRNKSQQTIHVTPGESRLRGTVDGAQIGRRIVIPRIEIPDINIAMPNIEVPAVSIPSININMPRVRVRIPTRNINGPI
ncbi:MAG TPA: PDZ domain-containing protein [Pyrinomonadaceae bacterium]|nr:PDZ domain-containing protein [Pyrinomonadaceae bacterium]